MELLKTLSLDDFSLPKTAHSFQLDDTCSTVACLDGKVRWFFLSQEVFTIPFRPSTVDDQVKAAREQFDIE
jgi:hypothetical protein